MHPTRTTASEATIATRASTSVAVVVAVLVALLAGLLPAPAVAKPSEHPFEIVPGSFHFTPSTMQAGAHSDWVTSFDFAHEESGATYNDARTIVNELPAGFDASNTAVPTCTDAQLLLNNPHAHETLPNCPIASQIGQVSVEIFANPQRPIQSHITFPLYNMEVTSFGVAAELGFKAIILTQVLHVEVRPGDTGLTAVTPNIPDLGETHGVSVTVWGLPASHEHDAQRAVTCGGHGEPPPVVCRDELEGIQEAKIPVRPFLSNPTSCGMFEARMEAESWEEPGEPGNLPTKASVGVGPIVECDRVPFEPSIEVQPSTRAAESPTGLEVSLVVPQTWENPYAIATANLKDATVTLPLGMTVNPSAGSGLGACTPGQFASETSGSPPGAGCPAESKIGSIDIETPLLNEVIHGAVYLAAPYDNVPEFGDAEHPGGSLLALYIVAKDPARGILIKVAGRVAPDPVTGRLTTTFLNNPQQPFSRFTLKFRPGATAPLVSPPACGGYAAQAALTPWSAPLEPRLVASEPFQISEGVREGPCPSGGVPPFSPHAVTGTLNNAAGSYSPFYLRVIREDGEQEVTGFSTVMPPGLTGNLSGVPFCPDAAIEAARQRTGGQELAQPSCPAASRVGHSVVGAGVGTVLAQTPGGLYLAGPYHGAPLSLVSITSATVGPFDLGTVVIRFALRINPLTAQVEVDATGSDPIPHIIRGIVVHVRDIRAYVDRPDFIKNPTSCEPMSIANTVTGAGADPSNPADEAPVAVASRFQASECQSLGFKPRFQASVTGKASKANGVGLKVEIAYPTAPQGTQANIKAVKVELPVQLPSRLTTLQKACLKATFDANPAACPPASMVGDATAITPILPVPLTGPAYFVSNGNAKFPELVIVLQGYGITIDLHGETFINKAGITSSTFRTIPDQPVTSFELTLPQGKYSARRKRQPVRLKARDADSVHRAERDDDPPVHADRRHGLSKAQEQSKSRESKNQEGESRETLKWEEPVRCSRRYASTSVT
jgi:hypothetical protein